MGMWVGRGRKARQCYGFDEIALVPSEVSINPAEVDPSFTFAGKKFKVPIWAASMDGVVDVPFAIKMGKLGGVAVLNLDGVQTRYDDPLDILSEIANSDNERATALLQKLYQPKIKEKLITKRVREIKAANVPAFVSSVPPTAERFGRIAQDAGADCFVVQSQVSSAVHISSKYKVCDYGKLCSGLKIPVAIGNVVTYKMALQLMELGAAAVLVGVGPGSACTTRGVLGIGVPQVTATCDAAAARDFYYKTTGRYVPIITDGGMNNGGDICKAFASGADSVMVGSVFAKAKEAPGQGHHWGMATPHANLPRGTRVHVGTTGTLKQIVVGPAHLTDGTQNIMGAIRSSMGAVGASTIKDFQLTELIIAPSFKSEGKRFQTAQQVGMCTNG